MEKQEMSLQPGQQIKPNVSQEEIFDLVRKLYNLEVDTVKELNSYDDRNFYITVKDDSILDERDRSSAGYLLKVTNSLDSQKVSYLTAQNEMMLYLADRGISCPRPVHNVGGKLTFLAELNSFEEGKTAKFIVRLLSFLEGKTLHSVECTQELFYELGQLAANVVSTLERFKDVGIEGVDRIWNLSSVPKLKDFVYAVNDETRRNLANEVIDYFVHRVVPCYNHLSSGPIHGDLNEQNVLVRASADGVYHVSGVIDFGDIHQNFYIFELAIAVCYMMLESGSMSPLDAAGHVIAGYHHKRPVSDEEFSLIKACVAGRLCQSLVLGAYSYSLNPDPYVLTTAKRGWQVLEQLWQVSENTLQEHWLKIVQSYNNN